MIQVDGLTKYYGPQAAIKDLTFKIERGEVIGFLGLNGAGKTTTLRVLGCVLLPTAGRVGLDEPRPIGNSYARPEVTEAPVLPGQGTPR